jgi:hypothetical protein
MYRVRRWLFLAALTGAVGVAAGCNSGSGSHPSGTGSTASAPKDLGPPLYAKAKMPEMPPAQPARDPIVIAGAVVSYYDKQTVPAQVDAFIDLIAVELPPGTPYDPKDDRIRVHPREKDQTKPTRVFYRLAGGERVKAWQKVAWLDDQAVEIQYRTAGLMELNADEQIKAAQKSLDQIDELLKLLRAAEKNGAASLQERIQLEINKNRFTADEVQAKDTKIKATSDKETAETLLRKHRPQAAVTGIVKKVFKNPGEFVSSRPATRSSKSSGPTSSWSRGRSRPSTAGSSSLG